MESTTEMDNTVNVSESGTTVSLEELRSAIYPTTGDWILIVVYFCTFIVGLIGNSLVCFGIIRNKKMRTTTNYFIMNLAVADLAVIVICLPLSLVYDVTSTWFFGTPGCWIYSFLSTFSINVSVLTLSAISIERWHAICHPLRFHSTLRRAKVIIALIWLMSALASLPITISSYSSRHYPETVYFTRCYPSLLSERELIIYQLCFIVGLYVLPLGLMAFAYTRIVLVLWKNKIPRENTTRIREPMLNPDQADNDLQCESRRKAAKMLIAVVIVFAFCYLPNHILNILLFTGIANDVSLHQVITISAMTAHWLVTFNSCINPIIYNCMSGKFRKEFRESILVCVCCACCSRKLPTMNDSYQLTYNAGNHRTVRTIIGNIHTHHTHHNHHTNHNNQHNLSP